MKIDKIVLHTAFTMSEDPCLIENVRITSQDKLIYICGHGNPDKMTIAGRSVEDISKLLIKRGWFGQLVYITSCGSDKLGKGQTLTIREALDACLRDFLMKVAQANAIYPDYILEYWIGYMPFVLSDATGHTITIQDDNAEPAIYILEFSKTYEYIVDFQSSITSCVTGMRPVKVDRCGARELEKLNKKYYKYMQKYKNKLLMKYGFRRRTLTYAVRDTMDRLQSWFYNSGWG